MLVEKFKDVEVQTNLTTLLTSLHFFGGLGRYANIIILQLSEDSGLIIHEFTSSTEAEKRYFELERRDLFNNATPKDDFVLVAGETFAHVRAAYLNYFSDAREFLRYIYEGCKKLQGVN